MSLPQIYVVAYILVAYTIKWYTLMFLPQIYVVAYILVANEIQLRSPYARVWDGTHPGLNLGAKLGISLKCSSNANTYSIRSVSGNIWIGATYQGNP